MRFLLPIIAAALATPALAQPADKGGIVIGYVAAFKGLDREMQQPGIDRYTHLDLAFVNPTPSGELVTPAGLACAPRLRT